MEFIDIGLNLTHESFEPDRAAVLAAAASAGVSRMILTGTTVTASAQAAELSLEHPGRLYATAGIHPHHASSCDGHALKALESLLANASVVAVGECGLDFFRNFSPRDDQLQALEAQLELAAAVGMPVFLHERDAHEDMLRVLRRHRANLVGGVAHCFTGDSEQLAAYLDLDLYVGITGWVCDERRGDALRRALPGLPPERLLLESDAPYLLPRDLTPMPKSRRNEPRFLPHIAQRVARLKDMPLEDVAAAAVSNTENLFGLDAASG